MKINPETMGSWTLPEILERVSWPDFPESAEPQKKVGPGEKPIGVVASLVARNFYTMGEMINRPVAGLSLPRAVTRHRGAALNELFWLTVMEEHPVVAQTGAEICEGWVLVGLKKKESSGGERTFAPDDSILRTYGARIVEIFSSKVVEVSGEEILDPRADGEGLLYVVEDARLRSLRMLRAQLKAEERQQTPANLNVDNPESLEAWLRNIAPAEAKKVIGRINEYREAERRLAAIFFAGVRDEMPHGHAVRWLALRQGWEIVESASPRITDAGVIAIPMGLGGPLGLGNVFGDEFFASLLRDDIVRQRR